MAARSIVSVLITIACAWSIGCQSARPTRWTLDPAFRAPPPAEREAVAERAGARATSPETRHFVFSSFRDVHPPDTRLLYSSDGLTWRWLNGGEPVLRAEPGMRDPHIARGPDGVFHMVWTNADFDPYTSTIGYARSEDLITWSEPRNLPVMAPIPGVEHCWAPELFWLDDEARWLVYWSSTVRGYAPPETAGGEPVGNHRIWATHTADFQSFGTPFVLFDPGYTVIDATILPVSGAFGTTYYLVFKDERLDPRVKAMRVVTGPTPRGPWSAPSGTFTRPWSEAPSAVRLGEHWYVYFDAYSRGYYGAVRSPDLVDWRDVTDLFAFPPGHRHGSVLEIDGATARRLLDRAG